MTVPSWSSTSANGNRSWSQIAVTTATVERPVQRGTDRGRQRAKREDRNHGADRTRDRSASTQADRHHNHDCRVRAESGREQQHREHRPAHHDIDVVGPPLQDRHHDQQLGRQGLGYRRRRSNRGRCRHQQSDDRESRELDERGPAELVPTNAVAVTPHHAVQMIGTSPSKLTTTSGTANRSSSGLSASIPTGFSDDGSDPRITSSAVDAPSSPCLPQCGRSFSHQQRTSSCSKTNSPNGQWRAPSASSPSATSATNVGLAVSRSQSSSLGRRPASDALDIAHQQQHQTGRILPVERRRGVVQR